LDLLSLKDVNYSKKLLQELPLARLTLQSICFFLQPVCFVYCIPIAILLVTLLPLQRTKQCPRARLGQALSALGIACGTDQCILFTGKESNRRKTRLEVQRLRQDFDTLVPKKGRLFGTFIADRCVRERLVTRNTAHLLLLTQREGLERPSDSPRNTRKNRCSFARPRKQGSWTFGYAARRRHAGISSQRTKKACTGLEGPSPPHRASRSKDSNYPCVY